MQGQTHEVQGGGKGPSRALLRGLAGLWLACLLGVAAPGCGSGDPDGAAGPAPAAPPPSPQGHGAPAPAPAGATPALPRIPALDGVDPRGAFEVDEDGAFRPGPGALQLFAYYLELAAPEPVERVRPHIEAAIRAELRDPAPAIDLLDRYLGYREALRAVDLADLDLQERFDALAALRREHFGPELAGALFAAEEERARFEIRWQRIAGDASLSDEERERRLEALEEELPAPIRLRRKLARAALALDREEQAMRARGASEEEIRAAREERLGPTARARVEQLRDSRARFEARLAQYRAEREELLRALAEAGAEPARRTAELEALRARHFEPHELERLSALEPTLAPEAGGGAADPPDAGERGPG